MHPLLSSISLDDRSEHGLRDESSTNCLLACALNGHIARVMTTVDAFIQFSLPEDERGDAQNM
jgi:hypothetical protein